MNWYKNDGIYYSEDDRFRIMKATDRIHSGDWELYDSQTRECYYKPTLRECKYIAEKWVQQRSLQGRRKEDDT